MPSGRIVLAGGSGFLGRALAGGLAARGYQVIALTRSPQPASGPARYVFWDGRRPGDWVNWLDGAVAVVNLVGRSIDCRYTPETRREIVESRVESVAAVGEAVATVGSPPRVWVQAGSLAIYGDAGERVCDEEAPCGHGFSVEVCRLWEKAFHAWKVPETRKVLLRIGFVLGRDRGALARLVALARWGLGGRVGSGRQYVSWLHVADMNAMFLWSIERDEVAGVLNATGPNPVTNAAFMQALRRAVGRPWSPPVPAWAVRLGARLIGTEADLALNGRRGVPAGFLRRGFAFRYPDLDPALRDLLA